ncbi:hypothetical protein EBR03_00945, partial [bacterium]|nr:hypothetical protein [bacterium]
MKSSRSQLESGMSLRHWFYLNARIPLLISAGVLLSIQVLLLVLVAKNEWKAQQGVAERLGQLSLLALTQKSTALLQAGFEIATKELGAVKAFVCEHSWIYVLREPQPSDCKVEARWGYRVIQVPLNAGYSFFLQVPIFPSDELMMYALVISLGMTVMAFFFLKKMRSRLEQDLFTPLLRSFTHAVQLPIRELEQLRKKMLQLHELKTQKIVTAALVAQNQQMAHDMKSPLTALLFASRDFEVLPEGTRGIVKAAVKRIAAIADGLLEPNPHFISHQSTQFLRRILEELFQDKRLLNHLRLVQYIKINQIHFTYKNLIDILLQLVKLLLLNKDHVLLQNILIVK